MYAEIKLLNGDKWGINGGSVTKNGKELRDAPYLSSCKLEAELPRMRIVNAAQELEEYFATLTV